MPLQPPGYTRRPGLLVQGHGQGPARRRDRGDPRRGLQPHGRGGPAGAHLHPGGPGQPHLLHPGRRRRALPEPQRLREHRQLQPSRGAHPDPGLPALLGDGDARGWVPVRPRLHPRTGLAGASDGEPPADRAHHRGPRAAGHQAHRRGLGRGGRLPGGQLPRPSLVRVERPLPRRRAPVLARGSRHDRRPRHPPRRQLGSVPRQRPVPSAQHQLRDQPRRLHPRGSGQSRPAPQRGQRRGEPRRLGSRELVEPRPGGAQRRSVRPRRARSAGTQHAADPAGLPGGADAARRRRDGAHPGGQQQRVLPRRRDVVVRLAADPRPRRSAPLRSRVACPAAGSPGPAPHHLPRRTAARSARRGLVRNRRRPSPLGGPGRPGARLRVAARRSRRMRTGAAVQRVGECRGLHDPGGRGRRSLGDRRRHGRAAVQRPRITGAAAGRSGRRVARGPIGRRAAGAARGSQNGRKRVSLWE